MNNKERMPEHWKNNCLTEDYERILDEMDVHGTNIEWVDGIPMNGRCDMSVCFMYPSIILPLDKSTEA